MKSPSVKYLRGKLDEVFSVWIRQRGMSQDGLNKCVTCGAVKNWKNLQCGHYVSRVHLATRYLPENAAPQCSTCNVLKRGNMSAYALHMLDVYGQGTLEELERLKHTTIKLTREDYEYLLRKFRV